jgi:hypothetical protein
MNLRHPYQGPNRRRSPHDRLCLWAAIGILLFLVAFWGAVAYFILEALT